MEAPRPRMGIRLKFNLVLVGVAAIGVGLFALISGPFLVERARENVLLRSRIMMASAAGIRQYTAEEIAPLLTARKDEKFHVQAVAAYSAMKTFSVLRGQFPDYNYREAALNPTNLADRATESETDIINAFRADPAKTEALTERETYAGRVLSLSRPLIATQACLACHDTPELAPLPMLAAYGSRNGFGWKLNEIIGAQIVSVPMALPLASAARTLNLSLILLAAVFGLLVILTNVLMSLSIIRPIVRMSRVAADVSMGKPDVEEYVRSGSDEVARLSVSLNLMRRSLDEAIRLLSEPKR
jgi:HAMP domain-containing protein